MNRYATLKPLSYEIWIGINGSRRKIEVHSRIQADRIADELERRGERPEIWCGNLLVREAR